MESSFGNVQWGIQSGMAATKGIYPVSIDTGLNNTLSMPTTPVTIPSGVSFQGMRQHQQDAQFGDAPGQLCPVPSSDILEILDVQGLNSAPSPTITSSAARRERDERVEILVEPVLRCLGPSFIDRLVDELRYVHAAQEPGCSETDSNNHDSPSSSQNASISASTASAITSTTGSKRRLDAEGDNLAGDDDDDDDGDKGDRKRQRLRSGHPKKQQVNRPFACPFRKNNPERYSYNDVRYKTCVTTSWRDISHLKLVLLLLPIFHY